MPRAKLPAGSSGEIVTYEVTHDGKTRYRAVARFRDPSDGKRKDISRYRDTKGAARAAVRAELARRLAPVETQGTTVQVMLDRFLAELPRSGLAAKTQQDYAYAATYVADNDIAKLSIEAVSVAKVKEFLAHVSDKHGPGAAKHARAVLRHSMELAVESEEIGVNPVAQLKSKVKRKAPSDKSKKVLDDETLAEFMKNLYSDTEALPMQEGSRKGRVNGHDVADLVNFLFATGSRIGEALALRWQDVDFDQQVVSITGTVAFITGEGAVRQDKPKTQGSVRAVPITAQTAAMLENRMRRLGPDVPLDAPVFGSPQKPLVFRDPSNLYKIIRRLFDRYGVDWAGSHLGRRYRVTSLAERGVPLHKIADMVGHASVGTTYRYLGRSKDVDQQVRDAL